MATVLDTKIIPKVVATLNKYGRNLTIRTLPGRTVDTLASKITDGVDPTDYTVKGSPPVAYNRFYVNGDTIKASDCYVIILATDTSGTSLASVVKEGMIFLIDGKTWKGISVITHSPGEQVAAYEIQLRS